METRTPADLEVVIPAYKAERTIGRTIDSLLAQEGIRPHIIVVVDGLFDQTVERLRGYDSADVTVIVEQTNRGAASARNRGLELVKSDYVMFIDADDLVEGSFIRPLKDRMDEDRADIGFAPLQILFEQQNRRLPRFVPDWREASDVFRDWHGRERFVGTVGTMWRTSYIRSIGAWDPEISRNDDGELVMRAILRGARFTVSSAGQGVYVHHSSASMNNRADNMDSLLLANQKLLAIEPVGVSKAEQLQVCAEHYLNIACHAYLAGRDDVGDAAYARSRSMGVRDKGSWPYRLGFRLLGPKRLSKLVRWLKGVTPSRSS